MEKDGVDLLAYAAATSMRALTFVEAGTIALSTVPVPCIESDDDAIIRVHLAGICGSDLHPFHGREPVDAGCVFGHECVGTIVAVGPSVRGLAIGDMVMCPFTVACGLCFFCRQGLSARCIHSALLGWRGNGVGLHGCQAEFVRIPQATGTLCAVGGLTPEEALLIGDIFTTGVFCATNAGLCTVVAPNATQTLAVAMSRSADAKDLNGEQLLHGDDDRPVFVVVGCGPVGLCTIAAATELLHMAPDWAGGKPLLYAVDSVQSRLKAASELGATPVRPELAEEVVRTAAGHARGAAAVMECVGSPAALGLAYTLLRPGGILSSVGVHTAEGLPFTPGGAYDKNITWRIGRCPARSLMPLSSILLGRLKGRGVDLARTLITHSLPLYEGVRAYAMFDAKEDGCTKVVLRCRPEDGGQGGAGASQEEKSMKN